MNTVQKLKSVGINVNPYKRGPLGNAPFSIAIVSGKIRVWDGSGVVEVKTNKRKRHCLITVTEDARTIKERIVRTSRKDHPVYKSLDLLRAERPWNLDAPNKESSRLSVPNSRFTVKSYKQEDWQYKPYDSYSSQEIKTYANAQITYYCEHITKATVTTFLVGYDEANSTVPFICQLKEVVDTFDQAYVSLLPVGVSLSARFKRHGEWFLNPVSDTLNKDLIRDLRKAKVKPLDGKGVWAWDKTTHNALMITRKGDRYVIGEVQETRKGRHDNLLLTSFHKVYRNNEFIQPTNVRNFD